MKNIIIYFFLVTASFFITSCKKQDANPLPLSNPPQAQSELANAKLTVMVFTEAEYDFGTIKQGKKVMHVFTFKNTGKNDLVISRALGSCGCTVPEYPKQPISPGKTAKIKVFFNSTGKKGAQQKTVSVYANVPNGGVVITIKANIIV